MSWSALLRGQRDRDDRNQHLKTRVGFSTSEYGQDYRIGYGLGILERESLTFELGVDAQRRTSPLLGGTSNGVARAGHRGLVMATAIPEVVRREPTPIAAGLREKNA